MSLQDRLRPLPVTSLYYGVALAMVITLSLAFLAFRGISDRMEKKSIDPVYDKFDELQLESARGALGSGGPVALKTYLTRLNTIFDKSSHYLLDAKGIDLVSGTDRSELLPPAPLTKWRIQTKGRWIVSHASADGKYWFVAVGFLDRPHVWTFLPYYFLVIGAALVLCWIASYGVVSPIRRIASSIALFGHGDLSVRVRSERRDEIGQLGRSFNQMAERLQRLIVSERRLLGDISHELRSPLARLKFAIKLARTSSDSNAALDRIERDVDRITSLVSDIVEITFVEGDPAVQGTELVRPGEIIDEVVRDCALEAQAQECSISVQGRLRGELFGNRELLRRAVENVLRNSIRYSPQHSTIEVSIAEADNVTSITVRDFGPGVPEDALARIFDPFFRVDEARDAKGGGSGLGLSIAKRAVQVHHGTIVAQNAQPGLRVQIVIPLFTIPAAIESDEPALLKNS